jgi:CBS domain-containing protein
MKKVKDILREQVPSEIYSVLPNQDVLSAAHYLEGKNLGAVPVLNRDQVVGMISERDMVKKVLGPGLDPRDVTVENIMTRNFVAASPDDSTDDCLLKMREAHCRHLPVLENDKLLGTVSMRDVLAAAETEFIENYLQTQNRISSFLFLIDHDGPLQVHS